MVLFTPMLWERPRQSCVANLSIHSKGVLLHLGEITTLNSRLSGKYQNIDIRHSRTSYKHFYFTGDQEVIQW